MLPSRLASQIVPVAAVALPASDQYRWPLSTATPHAPIWPVTIGSGLLPSRLACMIVPGMVSAQYRWLLSTATPNGLSWPVTMACGLVPSRLASSIEPSTVVGQYRWADTPVPVSAATALAPDLIAVARSVAVLVPTPAVNCTITVQDLPGPRLAPAHVSATTVNAAGPDSVIVIAPEADPPELASVSVCDAVCPVVTSPKSYGDGVKASTGCFGLATAAPAAETTTAAASTHPTPAAAARRDTAATALRRLRELESFSMRARSLL